MEGWLSRIATNAFLDDMRKRKRRPAVVMAAPPDDLLPAAPAADVVLDSIVLPEQVQEALAGLPEEFRASVVLCDVVGQSYDQIAETLAVPVGTVRSRIHRGRALLRTALGVAADDGVEDA
jgi:RNA polymerase sigma-70 factor (ECF subfamily)